MTIADAISVVTSGNATLIDVRTNKEYADGHAKGAKNFDVSLLVAGHDPGYPKDRQLYLYCRSGARAQHAQAMLERMGYQKVINLGALASWEAAGGQTASGAVCKFEYK